MLVLGGGDSSRGVSGHIAVISVSFDTSMGG